MKNKRNLEEFESILASIDESSTDYDSDNGYISTRSLKYIWYGRYVHPYINARDSILKICYRINKAKNDWTGAKLSAKRMGKILHKLFKAVINYFINSLPTLRESGSVVQ